MTKKKLIGVLVAVALAVAAYFYGPDIVDLVREQVDAVAPVTSETETDAPAEAAPGEVAPEEAPAKTEETDSE